MKADNVVVKSVKTEREYVLCKADKIGYPHKLAVITSIVRNVHWIEIKHRA